MIERSHPLHYAAVLWAIAGLAGWGFTWPQSSPLTDGGTSVAVGAQKAGSVLILFVALLAATLCAVGGALVGEMRRLRAERRD